MPHAENAENTEAGPGDVDVWATSEGCWHRHLRHFWAKRRRIETGIASKNTRRRKKGR